MGSRIRSNVEHLFECFCEVSALPEPRLTRVYPEAYRSEDILRSVPKFVYPCDFALVGFSRFSFVLTCADSKWMYGFCRHEPSTPLALVFLSHLPIHDRLYRLLDKMAQTKREVERGVTNSLIKISDDQEDCENKFPAVFIKILEEYYCEKPPSLNQHILSSIPKNVNLTEYYCAVNYKGMISIMAALLHERRIIVRSKKPCRLSACVQAANDLLYPLVWQHIFIPVLPSFLSDYLLAPMPFLIGVPESVFKEINLDDIGEVVILDADRNVVESPFDDVKDLPSELVSNLLRKLHDCGASGDTIPREFLRTITYLIGGCREALRYHNGLLQFDSDIFISSRGPAMKPFLQKLITLQTFQQFIEDRMDLIRKGATQSDEFERECCNLEAQGKSLGSRTFGAVGKKISLGNIMRQVKEKTHPAMETAVESMRSGSRGVRSAYKGLRSRVDTNLHGDKVKPPGRHSLPSTSGFSKVKNDTLFTTSCGPEDDIISNRTTNGDSDAFFSSNHKALQFDSLPLTLSMNEKPPSPLSPLFHNSTFFIPRAEESFDLIKLNDNETTTAKSSNTDEDLLHEYGLDFEKFNISRKNWTTFDE